MNFEELHGSEITNDNHIANIYYHFKPLFGNTKFLIN